VIDGVNYLASRLAWLYMTGVWPNGFVDHRDRNVGNNTWDNLRDATRQQNNANSAPRSALGVKGVYRSRGKYRAQITINGRYLHLGVFRSVVEAAEVYQAAAKKHHGEFAYEYPDVA
jgi:hypothetical protein